MTTFKAHICIAVFCLQAIFTALAVTSVLPGMKSATCDELAHHIPVGYVMIEKGDLKMDPSQPPLPRYIAALPLKLFMDVKMPDKKEEWRREDRSLYGKDFFYRYNSCPGKMLFYSRLGFVVIGVVCGVVLFVMARSFYGEKAALFSLFLYSFSPNILAHTRLATADITGTAFILLAVYSFWLFIKTLSTKGIFFAALCLGLAQLSKYTSVFLYPMFLLLVLFELPGRTGSEKAEIFLKTFLVFAGSVLVLWAGYGFDTAPILADAMRVEEKLQIAHAIGQKLLPFWNDGPSTFVDGLLLSKPFPLGTYVLGVLGVMRHGYEGHGTYFLGEWSGTGHPVYFIVAALIKTPIPSLIFFLSGLAVSVKSGIKREERFLLLPILIFFALASMSKLQLGLRYILPVYPLCFILAARSVDLFKKKATGIIAAILILWYAASAIWIWPNYLSYFNEFIGGPRNGYKYLRDSNVDWGQDLPALSGYLDKNGIGRIKLLYFGTADPTEYEIEYDEISPREMISPGSAVYAVSAHKIDRVVWAAGCPPDAMAGYSIFIYDRREERPDKGK